MFCSGAISSLLLGGGEYGFLNAMLHMNFCWHGACAVVRTG